MDLNKSVNNIREKLTFCVQRCFTSTKWERKQNCCVHMFIRSVGGAFQMYERQKDKGNIKLKKDRHKQNEFSTTWHFESCLLRGFITDKALEN